MTAGLKRRREEYSVKREGGRERGGGKEKEKENASERREVPRESEGDWKERNGRDAADIA